ncbi:MAG: chromosomal replication initiator protein DnaA [Gammaproteobacteria bacterium]|nr:chromosomal replication initiator protein DnaA [Gammaproteobacteria bacterium]MBU1656194.1 chromosomal replication initiator protein DnaA [Gammaproteobacteria bacterium]MBU1959759.1 chromosomal replication initiator protein DnaA [Gammaproteobacteria bacterium]
MTFKTTSDWDYCIERLRGSLTSQQFNTWILPLQVIHGEKRIKLLAPNRFVLDWVRKHYYELIISFLSDFSGESAPDLLLEIGSKPKQIETSGHGFDSVFQKNPELKARPYNNDLSIISYSNVNSDFTFETFVEGKSNQLARAASLQIGSNPGVVYNPFFIYGGVGLGKTHLLHAIGNRILSKDPLAKVQYLYANTFIAEMVNALQHNRMDEFKRKYRSVNALLIDDVHFFAGKERSQEEFFHTFNALFETQQQIVLASDRYPKEMNIEERLKSRFGWGLIVRVEPPELETRVAILKHKALQLFGVDIPNEVAFFIGKRFISNIRELEGALRRVIASTRFTGQAINIETTREALRDMLAVQDKLITIENIQKIVSEYFKIRLSDLLSPSRSRAVARPRQIAMSLAKELTNHSLPEIGRAFGGRDHTTVLYAVRKVVELRQSDNRIDEDYLNLLRTLMG